MKIKSSSSIANCSLSQGSDSSSSGRYYRAELDILRMLAFVCVLLHHMLPLGLGHLSSILPASSAQTMVALNRAFGFGLTLFFTLSSFLISELLIRERTLRGHVSAGQFYLRRILRIWPLYYFCIALGLFVAFISPSGPHELIRISYFAVFISAWDASTHGWIQNPLSPLWSISVEEQFYLFAPWIFGYLSRARLLGFAISIAAVSSWFTFILGQNRGQDYSLWASSLVQSQAFAAGMMVSLMLKGRSPTFQAWQRSLLVGTSLTAWFVAAYFLHVRYFEVGSSPGGLRLMAGYWLGSVGASLILVGFLGADSSYFPRWAIYLGRISFGLYAFHGFALFLVDRLFGRFFDTVPVPAFFLKILPVVGLDILLASISYRFLETPFLIRKRRYALVPSEPVAVNSAA
jgi:peptidoglycan/LPS O-acetylase OafA/YrhL